MEKVASGLLLGLRLAIGTYLFVSGVIGGHVLRVSIPIDFIDLILRLS